MKKVILILAAAALAVFACMPTTTGEDTLAEYAGNKVAVTSPTAPIPAEGGSVSFVINNAKELSYDISIPATASWLTSSRVDSTFTFTATANPSTDHRYASVGVVDTEKNIVITRFDVLQEGAPDSYQPEPVVIYKFSVSSEAISVQADDKSASFNVTAENVEWTAVSDNPAFTISPSSGNASATVSVSFPANTDSANEVKANITVSTASDKVDPKSFVVQIVQAKAQSKDPVKPAPGTVLAEWLFDADQADALGAGGIGKASLDDDNLPGNAGGPYVPSNFSGNGKIEYFNGTDKSLVSTSKPKRRIGERGELVVYCTYEGDYFIWSAIPDAPLAAGTKLRINFAIRPNGDTVMKYWKGEYLDGDTWKNLNEIELKYNGSAAGTEADPKEFTQLVDETVTLTAVTQTAQFRFTATSNTGCDGSPVAKPSTKVLRFAGKFSGATEEQKYLQVNENPKIMVVE